MDEHTEDLALASSAAKGDPEAIRVLDGMLRECATWAARRVDRAAAFADDVAQVMRERLLVGDAPKLDEYAGRAPLRSWLSTIAMRVALDMRRNKADRPHEELASTDGPVLREPELDYLRERYREHFKAAVREALAAAPAKDRALLRLHLGERLGIDKLAALYDVGRSTAHRWLGEARDRLVEATRTALCARLDVTSSEYESLAALVRSDVAVSVVRLLEEAEAEAEGKSDREHGEPRGEVT
jgi:RNA polymerase sigma-70 factor (ECF subfamily)